MNISMKAGRNQNMGPQGNRFTISLTDKSSGGGVDAAELVEKWVDWADLILSSVPEKTLGYNDYWKGKLQERRQKHNVVPVDPHDLPGDAPVEPCRSDGPCLEPIKPQFRFAVPAGMTA